MTINQLIQQVVTEGGAIVSSGDCTEMEIANAKASGRFSVRDDGMGFVRRSKEWLALQLTREKAHPNLYGRYTSDTERVKTGIELLAAERERQITAEGWSAAHDDKHDNAELAYAASCYAHVGAAVDRGIHVKDIKQFYTDGMDSLIHWPWEDESWKPSNDPLPNLVKAGALIAAEIDRLQRRTA